MVLMGRGNAIRASAVVAAIAVALSLTPGARAADDKPIVMKIALATLDDVLHQYAKNYAAAVEKDSGGRIKGRNLSGEPVGFDPAPGRRRAIRRHPMPDRRAGVFGRHR